MHACMYTHAHTHVYIYTYICCIIAKSNVPCLEEMLVYQQLQILSLVMLRREEVAS